MPDFDYHYSIGRKIAFVVAALSGVGVVLLTFNMVYGMLAAFVGYYSTILGSVLPDVDQSQPRATLKYASIPYRRLVSTINLLVILSLALALTTTDYSGLNTSSVLLSLVGVGLAIVVIRLIPEILHQIMPKHRGMTHKATKFWIPMGLASAGTTYWILSFVNLPRSIHISYPIIIGGSILAGAFTHISADSAETFIKNNIPQTIRSEASWVPRKLPIFLDIPSLLRVALDRRAPLSVRGSVVFVVGYALVPFNLIPNVIPVIGWIDDFTLYLLLRESVYSSYERNSGILSGLRYQFCSFRRGFILTIEIMVVLITSLIAAIFLLVLYLYGIINIPY